MGDLISRIIGIIIVIASILLLFYLAMSGIQWLTSGGEKASVAAARERMTNALIGLIIVLAAWAIFTLVKYLFGIPPIRAPGPPGPPPAADCAVICRDAPCPWAYADLCYQDCRCICNPGGNWYLDNPWCDRDTHQYVCQGGDRRSDSHGSLSGIDLNCPGD